VIVVPRNPAENVVMAQWAADVLNEELEMFGFDRNGNPLFQTMGFQARGKLACVIIVYQYIRPNIFMSIAATDPRWASRENLSVCGKWVFDDLECERITVFVKKRNKRSRKFVTGIGFKYEGNMRHACIDGDVIMYGLIKEDHQNWLRKAYGRQRLNTSRRT